MGRPGLTERPGARYRSESSADHADFVRLQALGALLDLELHLLSLAHRAKARRLNDGLVAENILAPTILSDESKALRIVKPLHCTSCHVSALLVLREDTLPCAGERHQAHARAVVMEDRRGVVAFSLRCRRVGFRGEQDFAQRGPAPHAKPPGGVRRGCADGPGLAEPGPIGPPL